MSGRRVRGSYGWWVEDVFWFSQLRRRLNPSSVEGFIPGPSAIGSTHSWDLCPKGVLGLGYSDVVTMLLSLISSLHGLRFNSLALVSRLLSLVL